VGVVATHTQMARATVGRIQDNLSGRESSITLTAVHRATREGDDEVVQRHLEALSTAEHTALLSGDYATLLRGDEYEVPFQPREFAGMRPVELRATSIEGDRVLVDLVMERISGGNPAILPLVLVNRPADIAPLMTVTTASHTPAPVASVAPPTASLPDKIEFASERSSDAANTSEITLWLAAAGTAGGIVVGLLLGFLFWG
jgi:hypothetical protein